MMDRLRSQLTTKRDSQTQINKQACSTLEQELLVYSMGGCQHLSSMIYMMLC